MSAFTTEIGNSWDVGSMVRAAARHLRNAETLLDDNESHNSHRSTMALAEAQTGLLAMELAKCADGKNWSDPEFD